MRPSVLAVFKFMTSSIDWITEAGINLGLSTIALRAKSMPSRYRKTEPRLTFA